MLILFCVLSVCCHILWFLSLSWLTLAVSTTTSLWPSLLTPIHSTSQSLSIPFITQCPYVCVCVSVPGQRVCWDNIRGEKVHRGGHLCQLWPEVLKQGGRAGQVKGLDWLLDVLVHSIHFARHSIVYCLFSVSQCLYTCVDCWHG